MKSSRREFVAGVTGAVASGMLSSPAEAEVHELERSLHIEQAAFAEPPKAFRQHAWLSYNLSRATEENMTEEVRRWAERDLTGSFYLGMGGGSTKGLSDEYLAGAHRQKSDAGIGYLSEEYFALYAKTIEAGLKNGNPPMIFYDEWGYPSGMAGGHLYSRYPQYGAKSLEKVERDIAGPGRVELQIPEGINMGAVKMNLDTRELVDISADLHGRSLTHAVNQGRWKVMAFYLDPKASLGQGNKSGYVDYLYPEAVRAYIGGQLSGPLRPPEAVLRHRAQDRDATIRAGHVRRQRQNVDTPLQ